MKKNLIAMLVGMLSLYYTCNDIEPFLPENGLLEERSSEIIFSKLSSLDLGAAGASEISAYDPSTHKLFVVHNTTTANKIDVLTMADPGTPHWITSINVAPIGGLVNSLAVYNGKLAAAIEAYDKVSPGSVAIYNTTDLTLLHTVTVGSLPDMVTFTPNGRYILTADEGEPNADYSIDPVGTISIIDVENGYHVTKLDFSKFGSDAWKYTSKGLKFFGPNASFAQDMEPEYITVSDNSKWAWVSLQENNAIARININSKTIENIFPLGFKNLNFDDNAADLSDRDNGIKFKTWPVKTAYEPDGLTFLQHNGSYLIYSANEGDAREYTSYEENLRLGSTNYKLDTKISDEQSLKTNDRLGRLNVTTALGDQDKDGDFDAVYTHGGRSFTIWSGTAGDRIYDSQNELDIRANNIKKYVDARSDDKGSEPETIIIGKVGTKNYLFVALERADAVMVYDLTNPLKPVFVQSLITGMAPEGLLFVPALQSASGKSLLIASCEGDGQVIIFSE